MNNVFDTEVFVNSKSHEYNNRNANSLNMQHLQNYWGIFINKRTITHSSLNIILQPNFYKMFNEHIFKLFLKTQRNHESSQKLSKVMVMMNSQSSTANHSLHYTTVPIRHGSSQHLHAREYSIQNLYHRQYLKC